MAIRFITGKPGDGKSMTAVQSLVRELVRGQRQIVTNLPIIPGHLWAFIKARHGIEIDTERITIIDEDAVKKFFLHRGRGWVAPLPLEKKEGGDGRIDYANCRRTVELQPGVMGEETKAAKDLHRVLYIIDEAHLHFGARQWADTAQSALFYLSQHRHLGDEVFFVTQHVKQVDAALRRLTFEFWRVTNYGARYPFGVKLPDVFVVDVFNSEPSLLGTVTDTKHLRLDVEGLGSCYDTAAGVGMVGGLADTQNKRKGIPWQLAMVALVALLSCGLLLPWGAGKWFGWTLAKNHVTPPAKAALPAVKQPVMNSSPEIHRPVAVPVTVQAAWPLPPAPAMNTNAATVKAVKFSPPVEPVKVKFYIKRENGFVMLGLDNGDVFSVGDGRLTVVGQLAILDGRRAYRLPE